MGAPLWRLIDFRDDVDPLQRNRLESALLASGLLDAWVRADGTLQLQADQADLILHPQHGAAVAPSLANVLNAEVAPSVERGIIERLLTQVALRDSALTSTEPAVIGRDGTFRLGNLAGRGPDRAGAYVGATAREQERTRRVTQLEERIAELSRVRTAIEGERRALDELAALLHRELAAAPRGDAVNQAMSTLSELDVLLADAGRRLDASGIRLRAAEQVMHGVRERLDLIASEHSLPANKEGLNEVERGLDALDHSLRGWANRRRERRSAYRALEQAERSHARAADELRFAHEALDRYARQHRELDARWRTVEAAIGAEYRDVLARLGEAEAERRRLQEERNLRDDERIGLAQREASLRGAAEDAETRRDAAEQRRQQAHIRFLTAVRAEFAADAGIEVTSSLTGASLILEAARDVGARHPEVDVNETARYQRRVSEAQYEADRRLAERADISFEPDEQEGWWILRASMDGIQRTVAHLQRSLADELRVSESELRAEEQRLFDETLTGGIREHIAARIRLSNELVARINGELDEVRTRAAEVRVRLRWEVDPDHAEQDALRAARELLLKDPASLGASERDSLHTFLRARIDHVRAGDDGVERWGDQLAAALDYRRWHRFTLQIAHRDWDGFRTATTAQLSRLSTGERSVALHLPMLASIAAHYDGMRSSAGLTVSPRLILLDELFVGVDTPNRAQLFGMLVAWDLDAVLTSDHEWCAYATLDGIAIHHVHADGPQSGTVTTSRFVWDGRARYPAPVLEPGP